MPTSVLLAVLAAAGLLALAPALVRRYDATERLVAERALSTARVLTRAGSQHRRRRRTVPGRVPINPPRVLARQVASSAAFAAGAAVYAASSMVAAASSAASSAVHSHPVEQVSAPPAAAPPVRPPRSPVEVRAARTRTSFRRRRALVLALLLMAAECAAAVSVARAFWIAVSFTGFLLVAFVVHLRNQALVEQRRRRAEARYAEWVRARQAAVRREQERRAAAKRELLERQLAARDEARRAELRARYTSRAVNE